MEKWRLVSARAIDIAKAAASVVVAVAMLLAVLNGQPLPEVLVA
jgi:hypothetical protein